MITGWPLIRRSKLQLLEPKSRARPAINTTSKVSHADNERYARPDGICCCCGAAAPEAEVGSATIGPIGLRACGRPRWCVWPKAWRPDGPWEWVCRSSGKCRMIDLQCAEGRH